MLTIHSLLNESMPKKYKIMSFGKIYENLCGNFPLHPIRKKSHHEAALKILAILTEYLTDKSIKKRERKQVLNYMEALGLLVEEYEKENFLQESKKIVGREILHFLIKQHGLKQIDLLNELGSQSIVSEILSGKRKLNNKQIAALSRRFGVSPAAFFPA